MSYKIEEIEGIGPVNREKLAAAGIATTDDLLAKCASASGRKATATTCGLDASRLLKWANMADLMRVSGVGRQYSELLEAAGVDTIKELRTRNAESLTAKLAAINAEKRLAKSVPSAKSVSDWIEQAKKTEPKISH